MGEMQCKLFDIQNKIRMAKNQTVTSRVQNILALNRVRKECYYQPIRVDFSPIQKPNNLFESVIPIFNHDGNYFTPAFVLKKQMTSMSENLSIEKSKFEARISHAEKPSQNQTPNYNPTDSKYCQLCNEYFADYFDHINDKYHKRMINSSKFNKDIMALCKSFEKQIQKTKDTKTKKIKKDSTLKKLKQTESQTKNKRKQKEQQEGISLQSMKMLTKTEIQKQSMKNITIQQKNPEQSLKIMLQLGNYSTNIHTDNTFKRLCLQS